MVPRVIEELPPSLHGGIVQRWDAGPATVLAKFWRDECSLCPHAESREAEDRLTKQLEAVAIRLGVWKRTTPSIDVWMIVVSAVDVPVVLQAFADEIGLVASRP